MNRNLATFVLATGLFATARQSYAWHNPVAFSRGDSQMTVYAVADSNPLGIYKKELTEAGWASWSLVTTHSEGSSMAVTPWIGWGDLIAVRTAPMVETNLLPGPPPNCIPSPCPPNSEWYNLGYIASAGPAVSALVGDVPRIFFVDQGGTLKQFMYTKSPGAQWPTWGSAVPIANAPVGLTEIAAGQVDPASFMICGITGDQYKCSPPIAVAQPWPTSAWTTLPGSYGSRPAVSTWLGYFPQVFGHSSFDSQLWDTISFLGWNNPVTQGGDIAGAPAAAGMNVGGTYMGTYVFAKAGWDNSIWYNIETRSGWMTWFPLN